MTNPKYDKKAASLITKHMRSSSENQTDGNGSKKAKQAAKLSKQQWNDIFYKNEDVVKYLKLKENSRNSGFKGDTIS
jgi:hypothetical protein